MDTVLTGHPQVVRRTVPYEPEWPKGWYIVFPKSTQLDIATKDIPIAAFRFETHAEKYAETWMPFVEIIKNGENEE